MHPALHTHPHSGNQIHDATCRQIIRSPQCCSCHFAFSDETMRFVGFIHSWDWSWLRPWQRHADDLMIMRVCDSIFRTDHMRLFCLAWVQTAHSSLPGAKTNLTSWLSVTWGVRGNRIRQCALGRGQYRALSKLHSGWHVVPASQQNATWLACFFFSTQHIKRKWPYLMWHGWQHL